jgi:PAS domain S-box-containing protein
MPKWPGWLTRARGTATTGRLVKYAVLLLLPVLALGVALEIGLRAEARQRGLDEARSEAALVAQTAVEPLLGARPLGPQLGATELVDLKRLVAGAVMTHKILRLRLHDLQGNVVFSDDGSGFHGRPDAGALAAARGQTVATLTRLNSDSNDSGPLGPAAVEVYEPLYAGAPRAAVGVLELYLPYAPINADVTGSLQRLTIGLIAGLAALYLVLLTIVVSVSRGLRRQVAVNAAQAEQLRVSERDHRMLFESNPQPMIAYDRDTFDIVAVSNAAVANYGYTREEFLAMKIYDVHPDADVPALLRRFESRSFAHRTGFTDAWQTRHEYKDGSIIDVEVSSDDLVLRGRSCRIALCQDVTERNRATADLAIARDHAIEASNMKSAFLANVSHEIRTPMNGVIGMNDLLLSTDLDDEQRSFADQVASSGEHMLTIINDILDISKIETGQLDLDRTDFSLEDALARACAVGAIDADAKGLSFGLEIDDGVPRNVHGDSGRLRQVVLNLVANAVKFTSEGAVTVAVTCLERTDEAALLRIEVSDDGIGIEASQLERMFEPFTQADVSTTRRFGGTGLGLAIARELTQLMGGRIGAESSVGHGSKFWVEVSLAVAAQAFAPAEATPAPAPRDRRMALAEDAPIVLVVDDAPVNQIVAVRALQRCGCRSDVAGDGVEALKALATNRYDAVLMDCQMPEMDGYAATTELRRREAGARRVPVIAMTASTMKGDLERCIAHGMDDFLSKPIRHNALDEVIHRWIPSLAACEEKGQPAAA